jgi:hypothetical protein
MKKVHSNLPSDHVVNTALRRLPRRTPPASLSASLRVMASRERARRANRQGFSATFSVWRDRTRLFAHNLMRPLALPAAGGLLSAVTLFGLWLVPTYPLRGNPSFDVPTGLSTDPVLKGTTALGSAGEEVVVDVTVDGQGRMIDYVVVTGARTLKNDALRRSLETTLLFTEFDPATNFGRPMNGKVRLVLRSSSVDVKG